MTPLPPILLMTRPEAASEAVIAALRARGRRAFEPVVSPLFSIEPGTGPLPRAEALIFTSANAVRVWLARGGACDLPVFAVGNATARAAREAGMIVRSADGDADALVAMILRLDPAGHLVHARGEEARGRIAERLGAAGLSVSEAILYRQRARPLSAEARAVLLGHRPVVAPLYSPRTAALFDEVPVQAPLFVAAMSEAVAKTLSSRHSPVLEVSAHPGTGAMLDCVDRLLGQASALETPGGDG